MVRKDTVNGARSAGDTPFADESTRYTPSPDAISSLSRPTRSTADKWPLVSQYIKSRGLVKQQITSFDYFLEIGLKKILRANDYVRFEQKEDLWLRFDSIRVGMPENEDKEKVTPQQCRISQQTYSAPMFVDVSYPCSINTSTRIQSKNIPIGFMPIMLHSAHCHLSNKSESELSALGECIYDGGGYFIVNGSEKVMLIQEQLAKNRIIINHDDKLHSLAAHVTSSTATVKSRTSMYFKKGQILVKHNSLRTPIPLQILFRAMDIESDQEIVQMVGADLISDLAPSLQHPGKYEFHGRSFPILTAKIAKMFVADRYIKRSGSTTGSGPRSGSGNKSNAADIKSAMDRKEREGEYVVRVLLYAHVGDSVLNKAIYMGLVARRLIMAKSNPDAIDDTDYYGNKRLESSGQLLSLLFEDKFKGMIAYLQRTINIRFASAAAPAQRFDARELTTMLTRGSFALTKGIEMALQSGNWNLARFKMHRAGVTQVVSRLSYISALGHMTRIASSVEKTRKTSGPRALHGSQWGMVCPSDTPEGEGCGLIKNLALTCTITLDEPPEAISKLKTLAHCLGMEDVVLLPHLGRHREGVWTVWLNGECIGVHRDRTQFVRDLRRLRRNGKISQFTSICSNPEHRIIVIATDQGRVCRPLIICEDGKSRWTHHHLECLESGLMSFDDFVSCGIIEYLDVNEENDGEIALSVGALTAASSHLEIDPMTMLGAVSGLIPFPHHNQSPRNTYQCAMGKQAMGTIGVNKLVRCDGLFYSLCYAQQPMVATRTILSIQFDRIPAGCNATVAVMSLSGYDIEDAVILNRASLDRGFMRCVVNRCETIDYKSYGFDGVKKDLLPKYTAPVLEEGDDTQSMAMYEDEAALDKDAIAKPGSTVIAHYGVLAIKVKPKDTNDRNTRYNRNGYGQDTTQQIQTADDFVTEKLRWRHMNAAKIEGVILSSNLSASANRERKAMILRILTREHRRPELGDKFSSRHGQKGVCGLIVAQRDLPFNDDGVVPDLIMNPHGFPSRMTVGKMIELLTGKAGVVADYDAAAPQNLGSGFMSGSRREFGDGSAFGRRDIVENVCKRLVAAGYSYSGKDVVTCGITGKPLNWYIFMGPVFYQKLKHMVADKMHARSTGPTTTLCRQPTEGRSRKGGLRVGEMERDCLIGHGASMLLYERLMVSSDKYECQICSQCQLIASIPGYCSYCDDNQHICHTQLPYACKLLFQELMSMNISPKIQLTDQF